MISAFLPLPSRTTGPRGRPSRRTADEIVRSWLGEVAVVVGSTTYSLEPGGPVDRTFDNCFVLRFDADGCCREFTDWYVERPRRPDDT